jgi:hypothetical protein
MLSGIEESPQVAKRILESCWYMDIIWLEKAISRTELDTIKLQIM